MPLLSIHQVCPEFNFPQTPFAEFLDSQTNGHGLGNEQVMALKHRIRAGIPKPLVLVLGLAWAWMTWTHFREQAVQPGSANPDIVLQWHDRELRLSEASKRANGYERWVTGADNEQESLEQTRSTIREIHLADLGESGHDLLDCIALRLGEPVTPADGSADPEYRRKAKEWLLAGNGRAWDFELFLNEGNDPEVLGLYRRENDRLLDRALWAGNSYNAVLLGGLVVGGCSLASRKRSPLPGSRIPDSWAATSVLGVFFLAELLLEPWLWILNFGYSTYYSLGGFVDLHALYDTLWRSFPVAIAAIVFLKYPQRIWRVFGLGKRIDWLLLLAALAALSAVDWLIYFATPATVVDPTDFMETTSPDLNAFALSLLTSVVLAPIFEEIAFRGFLFQGLKSKTGILMAAVISSILFAVVHTQYDFWGWISVGTMGLAACYLTHRTGSLKTAIAFHAIGNLLISLDVYFFYQMPI
jgi:membrane protease YdiL (CAAX protease family)